MPNHRLTNPDRSELSERRFREYEEILREFLSVYPEPFRCTPLRGALTTFVVRLREAANAVLANSDRFREPLSFDLETLRALWPKVQVSIVSDEVVIAERAAVSEVVRAKASPPSSSKPLISISNPTLPELAAFASVFQRRACAEPFLFVGEVPAFTPPLGVAFEQTPEGWMML